MNKEFTREILKATDEETNSYDVLLIYQNIKSFGTMPYVLKMLGYYERMVYDDYDELGKQYISRLTETIYDLIYDGYFYFK